ncbi:hypothetical protein [Moraxella caviae]|nr:hypothetical protein [Moraxella caviae]
MPKNDYPVCCASCALAGFILHWQVLMGLVSCLEFSWDLAWLNAGFINLP